MTYQERHAAYARRSRATRKRMGRCLECPARAAAGRSYCAKHGKKKRNEMRTIRALAREVSNAD